MALLTFPPLKPLPLSLEIPLIQPSRPRFRGDSPNPRRHLPKNVIKMIIDLAERTKDRKNWVFAAHYDDELYDHAIQNYYRFFVISRKNLVMDREKLETKHHNHGCDATELLRSVRPIRSDVVPATLVESLLLNCQYGYKPGMFSYEAPEWASILSVLEPHLSSLRKMQHYDSLLQPIWDSLLQYNRLKHLSIRQTDTLSLLRRIAQPQERAVIAGWERLAAIGTLRDLRIGQFLTAEAPGLAAVVRQMPKLQRLSIEAAPLATTVTHNQEARYSASQMPIARFLRCLVYKASMPAGFPVCLQKLTLIDNGHE